MEPPDTNCVAAALLSVVKPVDVQTEITEHKPPPAACAGAPGTAALGPPAAGGALGTARPSAMRGALATAGEDAYRPKTGVMLQQPAAAECDAQPRQYVMPTAVFRKRARRLNDACKCCSSAKKRCERRVGNDSCDRCLKKGLVCSTVPRKLQSRQRALPPDVLFNGFGRWRPGGVRQRACHACNKAKRRCDRGRPCGRCQEKGIACEDVAGAKPRSTAAHRRCPYVQVVPEMWWLGQQQRVLQSRWHEQQACLWRQNGEKQLDAAQRKRERILLLHRLEQQSWEEKGALWRQLLAQQERCLQLQKELKEELQHEIRDQIVWQESQRETQSPRPESPPALSSPAPPSPSPPSPSKTAAAPPPRQPQLLPRQERPPPRPLLPPPPPAQPMPRQRLQPRRQQPLSVAAAPQRPPRQEQLRLPRRPAAPRKQTVGESKKASTVEAEPHAALLLLLQEAAKRHRKPEENRGLVVSV